MIDAFEIGVTLALKDGVSAGIIAARKDMSMLERAISANSASLTQLRNAGEQALSIGRKATTGSGIEYSSIETGAVASAPVARNGLPALPEISPTNEFAHGTQASSHIVHVEEKANDEAHFNRLASTAGPSGAAISTSTPRQLSPLTPSAPGVPSEATLQRGVMPGALPTFPPVAPATGVPASRQPGPSRSDSSAVGPGILKLSTLPDLGRPPVLQIQHRQPRASSPSSAAPYPMPPAGLGQLPPPASPFMAQTTTHNDAHIQYADTAFRPSSRSDPSGHTTAAQADQGERAADTQGQIQGDAFLDGNLVGRWISRFLSNQAARDPVGPTGFDPRRNTILPGATIGS